MEANVQADPRWVHWKDLIEYLEIVNVHPIDNLEVFCILLKLYTTKFRNKQSSLRCDPQDQENVSGMKMLTAGLVPSPRHHRVPPSNEDPTGHASFTKPYQGQNRYLPLW